MSLPYRPRFLQRMTFADEPARGVYCPRPDRRVRRALDRLLTEKSPRRRGEYAFIMIAVLVMAIMLAGVIW